MTINDIPGIWVSKTLKKVRNEKPNLYQRFENVRKRQRKTNHREIWKEIVAESLIWYSYLIIVFGLENWQVHWMNKMMYTLKNPTFKV